MIPINKTSTILRYFQKTLLTCLFLVAASPCAIAQTQSEVDQTNSPTVKTAEPGTTHQASPVNQKDDESRKLSIFFMIGIAINLIMMLLFAVWFVGQWKKQNERKVGGKLK